MENTFLEPLQVIKYIFLGIHSIEEVRYPTQKYLNESGGRLKTNSLLLSFGVRTCRRA